VAHRAFFVCLTFFLSSSNLLAQQSDESWLSLSRLSLSASGSYHYAPWTKYNESLLLVQEAVQYNPAYRNPSGSLDQIKGDLTYQIEADYRVFSSFSVTIVAGWLHTEGVMDFHDTWGSTTSSFSDSYIQSMWLSSFHFGAGVAYNQIIDGDISLSAGASIVRFPANLDFQAAYLPPMTAFLFSANLKESALGVLAHVETRLRSYGPLSFVSRLEYRWLTLKNLRGRGSETDVYAYSYGTSIGGPGTFEAQLGEAAGYFGLIMSPGNAPMNSHLLHQLWYLTPVGRWWETQQPTSLDLSGVGISLGVSYEF
jgi:hypothetical protein